MDRRSVLAGAGTITTVGLAGCLAPFQPGETRLRQYHLELTVQNNHDRLYDVRTIMTDREGGVVFDRSFTLGSGEGQGFGGDFSTGEYTLTVKLLDRSESRSYWNTDLCDVYRVRTEIDGDGHVIHSSACQAEGADPPPIGGDPPTEPN